MALDYIGLRRKSLSRVNVGGALVVEVAERVVAAWRRRSPCGRRLVQCCPHGCRAVPGKWRGNHMAGHCLAKAMQSAGGPCGVEWQSRAVQ